MARAGAVAHIPHVFNSEFYDMSRLDEPEVFGWLLKAADLGDFQALDYALFLLWNTAGPHGGDEVRLKRVMERGVQYGHRGSLLAAAAYVQDIDPARSFSLYSTAASADDCRAQVILAVIFH